MSKRFKQVNIQQFAILVQEVDISKYSQEEYVDIIEEIYMTIFRHNTDGDFVIPTMPNEEGNWKVHKSSATKEEVMELIKTFRDTQKEKHEELKIAKKDLAREVRSRVQEGDRRE